ncbi:hypothetical protein [Nonomuraea sp. NPDC005692]|uniref:hypothetical protein n=1 Tax=Nonomuraea sp. NPDC005692 TaxID=3157168 RepID=UPI0033E6D0DF
MSTIAERTAVLTGETAISDFYGIQDIGVEEEGLRDEPSPWDCPPLGSGEWVATSPNIVRPKTSPGAALCICCEGWDEEPPDDGSWPHVWTGEIYLSTGRISALSMTGGYIHRNWVLDLGRRATTWRVRIRRKFLDNDREPLFPRDIYQVDLYMLQFWPQST